MNTRQVGFSSVEVKSKHRHWVIRSLANPVVINVLVLIAAFPFLKALFGG